MLFIFAAFIQAFTFITIMASYTYVLFAILKKKSEKGRSKAFSTCSAHLLSVSLFYGTLFFMYVHPGSDQDQYQDKMYSLFYTIIIPLLNPFIYSLRNKEVLGAFGEGDGTPLQYSCLENPMDGGAWCAAVHGVAKSQT